MTGASIVFSLNKRVKHDGICWMLCQIKSMHDEADLCRAKAANAVGAAVAGTTTAVEDLEGSAPRLGGWGEEKLAAIKPRTELRLLDEPAPQLREMGEAAALVQNNLLLCGSKNMAAKKTRKVKYERSLKMKRQNLQAEDRPAAQPEKIAAHHEIKEFTVDAVTFVNLGKNKTFQNMYFTSYSGDNSLEPTLLGKKRNG
ncbi:MAG: hypothetical protein FRX49_00977 [Trebouxia sp. A1-2]|nr:MAG: hypothetical protein FRX49_00977 [Trebouxia sp. A1-2]